MSATAPNSPSHELHAAGVPAAGPLPLGGSCGRGCAGCGCGSPSADSNPTAGASRQGERREDVEPTAAAELVPLNPPVASNSSAPSSPPPRAAENVLSTLEADGSRRWLRPRLAMGRLWQARRIVAYSLIVVFVAIPHLRIGGRPLILLDVPARQFTLFGQTFLPTDTLLLALLLVGLFLGVFFATALVGRVWCGWACPQTVYMEFLFRPIDRLCEGTAGKGGNPRGAIPAWRSAARIAVYVVLSMFLAHTFLAYFVGVDRLAAWVRQSPFVHPGAFLVMATTTALMLFHFLFFREQLCLIACPYGRFQSVMLDRDSLIVAYDYRRGEPRGKGRRQSGSELGDCVDCNQCVVVCPTGIDIRDGLQLECVNCTQCIDACNTVMDRVGSPPGLIRYSSQNAIDGRSGRLLRPRTVVYPLLLAAIAGAFLVVLSGTHAFDARLMRGGGAPFVLTVNRTVQNSLRLRLVNRSRQSQSYSVRAIAPDGLKLRVVGGPPSLNPGETVIAPVVIEVAQHAFGTTGRVAAKLEVTDQSGTRRELEYQLLGPKL